MILNRLKAIDDANLRRFHASRVKAEKRFAKGVEIGLKKAGLFLLAESSKIVPVDTGALRSSGRVLHKGKGFETEVRVVYGMEYSIYVHEDLEKAHGDQYNRKYAEEIKNKVPGYKKKRPEEQAKFLERPVRQNRDRIGKIVRDEAKKRQGGV